MSGEKPELAQSPNERPSGKGDVPNPELNPLMNPILSENLGRWAQVYFSNPPEKREQAVVQLLRELKGKAGSSESVRSEPVKSALLPPSPVQTRDEESTIRPQADVLVCASCQKRNFPGQQFCGKCGSPLTRTMPGGNANSISSQYPASERFIPQSSNFQIPAADDVEWLREKRLAGFAAREDRYSTHKIAIAVMILLATVVYIELRLLRSGQRLHSHAAVAVPAATSRGSALVSRDPASSSSPKPRDAASAAETHSAGAAAQHPMTGNSVVPTPSMAQPHLGTMPPPGAAAPAVRPAEMAPDAGSKELRIAEGYLRVRNDAANTAEGAKWLWKAVAKQNSAALLLLADLYERGEGVAKNCDQAQLLLATAAKRGSREGAARLRDLQSSGCH